MSENKNPHANHKKRMRQRFIADPNFNGFAEHEIVELLLSYSIVRKNTNNLAHELCDRFGNLSGILGADTEDIIKIKGLNINTANFLKIQRKLIEYYAHQKRSEPVPVEKRADEALNKIRDAYPDFNSERMYMITIDSRGTMKNPRLVLDSAAGDTLIEIETVVETAVRENAKYVFLAHNHVHGILTPSQEDIEFMTALKSALKVMDVTLVEHYIINETECCSVSDKIPEEDVWERIRKIKEEDKKNKR